MQHGFIKETLWFLLVTINTILNFIEKKTYNIKSVFIFFNCRVLNNFIFITCFTDSPQSHWSPCPSVFGLFVAKENKTKSICLHGRSCCHSASHSTCFCPKSFTYKCLLGLVPKRWLLHHQSWILSGTPLRCPAVALCHGDPSALGLQDHHGLQQFSVAVDV